MLTAIVVRPTPPFGENTATIWPSRSPPPPAGATGPVPLVEAMTGAAARRLCFSCSRA
jgi:hypothetical protein